MEILAAASRPLSINDIAISRPDLPRSSAYRHLVALQSVGVVRRIAAGDEYARFELDEPFVEHHHHLICTSCGNVVDIAPTPAFERSLRRHLDQLGRAHHFELDLHIFDGFGICAKCHISP